MRRIATEKESFKIYICAKFYRKLLSLCLKLKQKILQITEEHWTKRNSYCRFDIRLTNIMS